MPNFHLTDAPMSTAFQRHAIRSLMSKNELPPRKFCLLHRIPFRNAGLPDPPVDRPIDPHLEALSFAEASALIAQLKRQAGIEDDDDDD